RDRPRRHRRMGQAKVGESLSESAGAEEAGLSSARVTPTGPRSGPGGPTRLGPQNRKKTPQKGPFLEQGPKSQGERVRSPEVAASMLLVRLRSICVREMHHS